MVLLFAFALTAAACSGDEVTETAESEEDTSEDTAEETTDTAEEAEDDSEEAMEDDTETGTVTITGPERDESEAGAIQQVFDAWSEESGIQVTYTGSADWEAEINVAVEGGTAPDISYFPQPGKLADFARAGSLAALPDETALIAENNWDAGSWAFGTVDGAQYGIPAKTDLKSLVWYQPSRFEELGYTVPETLDELKELAATALADGNKPWCVGIESGQATGWPFTDWVEDMMLRLHGPDVYDQWVNHEIPFNDERIVQVFDEINTLWAPDNVFATGGTITATAFQDNGQPLVDGDCLMHRQASFFSAFIPEGTAFADGSEGAVDVFYFPPADDTRPILVAGTLAAAFHDRPEVWTVMEYIGSPEYANARQAAQKELKGGGDALSGFLSAVKGADPGLYAPLEAQMIQIMADAEIARFDASDLMPAEVGAGTFWSEGTSFINGDKSAQEAADAIEASWPS